MYKGVLVHIAQATLILSQYQVLVVVKCHDCKRRCCQRSWRGYCSGNYWGKKFSWGCWVEESIEETRRRREIIEQLLIRILGEREGEPATRLVLQVANIFICKSWRLQEHPILF